MGYYVINNLRKDKYMIKQLQDVSLKSLDMINKNAEGLNKLAEIMKDMQDNLNLMATKVLELEKRLEMYERPKN